MDGCEGTGQYHVASACDRIVLDPLGGVARLGLRADLLYFGEMLDSLGITVEKVAHGKYKTAGEQLVLRQASEGQKEALNAILDDWRDLQLRDFAAGRGTSREKMEPLCDGSMFTADAALAAGLVDTLADREGARKLLNRLAERREGHRPVSLAGWHDRDDTWADGGKVAVLWLDGAIVSGPSSGGFRKHDGLRDGGGAPSRPEGQAQRARGGSAGRLAGRLGARLGSDLAGGRGGPGEGKEDRRLDGARGGLGWLLHRLRRG
jgi:protease-4